MLPWLLAYPVGDFLHLVPVEDGKRMSFGVEDDIVQRDTRIVIPKEKIQVFQCFREEEAR